MANIQVVLKAELYQRKGTLKLNMKNKVSTHKTSEWKTMKTTVPARTIIQFTCKERLSPALL